MRKCLVCCFFVLPLFFYGGSAVFAADITDVADSFDYENNNPFDFRLHLSYRLELDSATIARERCEVSKDPKNRRACGKNSDQFFSHVPEFEAERIQHAMLIRPTLGLFKDFEIFGSIPIIFSEVYNYQLTAEAKVGGSSLRKDGIVSRDTYKSNHGMAVGDVSFGFRWGILNDERDSSKASFVIGLEWTLPTGEVWNPLDPRKDPSVSGGAGVGRGAHVMSWHIALSKRLLFFEPYAKIWYNLYIVPEVVRVGLQNGLNPEAMKARTVERALAPSHQGGFVFGSEFILWENKMKQQRFAFDLRFMAWGQFEGRDYNIFTDMLADYRPINAAKKAARASLITDNEQSLTFGGLAALHFNLAKYGYIRIEGQMKRTLDHFITFAKRGVDLDGNGFVDSNNPNEVYPYHVRDLDGIGKRLIVKDAFSWTFQIFAGLTL